MSGLRLEFHSPALKRVISGSGDKRSVWRGSNSRQEGPCRSQGGLASHCATDAPNELGIKPVCYKSGSQVPNPMSYNLIPAVYTQTVAYLVRQLAIK
ncbi:hypothetical protein PoB_001183000 [Plakobranchus ocellatus]|uniref:Uncharacterized protein n=1 Tax=Plakobranchus ocellatus TaxID=259542 RepID=A0AAV3YQA6_9GAST|nr:hypothetical protein PoB_001183000 [Plakobranchus ocellatus]